MLFIFTLSFCYLTRLPVLSFHPCEVKGGVPTKVRVPSKTGPGICRAAFILRGGNRGGRFMLRGCPSDA